MTSDFWRGRRVLITGGNGFIGAWLARTLIDLGAQIIVYDRSDSGALDLHDGLKAKVALVTGELTDQPKIEAALTDHRVNTLYHLGAQSSIAISRGSPTPAFDSNIRGTWTVLDACRVYGKLDTIAVAASNTVYGEQESAPFDESFPLNASHPYAASKACTDIIARCYAATWGLPIAVARATNTYGAADPHLDHIIPGTFFSLLRGERPVIRSDGSPAKGYLYILDTIAAYRLLGERAGGDDVRGRSFNFHPDKPSTVLELVEAMARVAKRPDLQPLVTGKPGTYEFEHLSAARARAVLGWAPRFSLDEGLRETFEWLKHHANEHLEQAAQRFNATR